MVVIMMGSGGLHIYRQGGFLCAEGGIPPSLSLCIKSLEARKQGRSPLVRQGIGFFFWERLPFSHHSPKIGIYLLYGLMLVHRVYIAHSRSRAEQSCIHCTPLNSPADLTPHNNELPMLWTAYVFSHSFSCSCSNGYCSSSFPLHENHLSRCLVGCEVNRRS